MKNISRLAALVLALLLALSSLALAEEPAQQPAATDAPVQEEAPAEEDPVLFTFDGKEFHKSQVDEILYAMMANRFISDPADYPTAIQYMVENEVLLARAAETGLNQFSEEELAAIQAEANQAWESEIANYVGYFLSEDTEEARAEARKNAIALFENQGFTLEMLVQNLKENASIQKVLEKLLSDNPIEVTDEEIEKLFQDYAAMDKESIGNDVARYEISVNYGQQPWYIPAGYRGIIHILLEVDEELKNNYQGLQAALEEDAPEGEADAEAPVTAEEVEAARQAILDSRADDIKAIYDRLAKGESFESLIAEYGKDPGMTDPARLAKGYEVNANSVIYDPVFTAAAFSEKMVKPGDVSDPVVGSFGIHILYYLRDIPEGAIELSEEIRAEISTALMTQKKNQLLTDSLTAWQEGHTVTYDQNAINAAIVMTQTAPPMQ